MKKFIVAILSILVGSVGYTIVDKTIETRVSDLESKVSYLEEIVDIYHGITSKNPITTQAPTTAVVYPDYETTTHSDGNQLLGYRYDAEGDFYYIDDKECWQFNAGYNEVYDNMIPAAAMQIDQIRIRFIYENKDWMIQLWKGQYGFLLIGAEIGVYTADKSSYTGDLSNVNYYKCADKEDWLNMELTGYWSENNTGTYSKIFEREYSQYWWATGFVKGQLTKYTAPRSELKLKTRITFKTPEMANLFAQGLEESGFVTATGSTQLVDDSFYQKGADVWFLWTTKYHDCFVNYNSGEVPTTTP